MVAKRPSGRFFCPQGPAGPAGAKGDKGDAGKDGTDGADGEDGKSVEVSAIPVGVAECEERGGAKFEVEGLGGEKFVCNGKKVRVCIGAGAAA